MKKLSLILTALLLMSCRTEKQPFSFSVENKTRIAAEAAGTKAQITAETVEKVPFSVPGQVGFSSVKVHRFPSSGKVKSVKVKAGDLVEPGDTLALLRDESLESQLVLQRILMVSKRNEMNRIIDLYKKSARTAVQKEDAEVQYRLEKAKFNQLYARKNSLLILADKAGYVSDVMASGFSKENIIAGLCEALVRNYLNNIAKGKKLEEPILFQGGVAFNKGIIAAFEKELGKKLVIPENFNVMGAIGSAILAKELQESESYETRFKGFSLSDQGITLKLKECNDCSNSCEMTVAVGDGKQISIWGDRCGKWQA